ncbi:MAG: DUF4397 domain-containing protein [Bacteroidetes bacterium]|nr:DUF4397 domain-containing protein [Bacteroidota bacterium]
MKKGLFTLLTMLCALVAFSQARVQVIHNSPFPGTDNGPVVDIYVNGGLLPELEAVPFRGATPFLDVPPNADLTVDIKLSPSDPGDANVASFDIGQLDDQTAYVVIANGIVGDPDTPFNLAINPMAQESASSSDQVEIAAFHGSPDAPNVDIGLRTLGNVFLDLPFGEFTTYAPLSPDLYYIDIRAAGNSGIVATFAADLNGLGGGAATVFASGFLGDTPNFGLFAALPDGTVVALPNNPVSRVQLVHNAVAPTVDVYASGIELVTGFEYRTATEFVFAPADIPLDIQVVAEGGDPNTGDVYDGPDVTLENGATYVVFASGLLGSPDQPLQLLIEDMGLESNATPDEIVVNIHHGGADAPAVNVDLTGVFTGDVVDGLEYGDFTGYVSLPAAPYFVDVEVPSLGNVILPYYADLRGLEGEAAIVFASGLLANAPDFGLFAVLNSGDVIELPLLDEEASVQLIHNSPTAAAGSVDVYLNGAIAITDFDFRTATPYTVFPAGVPLEIGVAVAGSSSVQDTVANFTVTFDANETYIVAAGGLVGDPDTPFALQAFAGTKVDADDPTTAEFIALHGAPGAPNVDVDARAVGNLISDLPYGEYTSSYTAVPAGTYYLDVKAAGSPDIVATFEAPLGLFEGQAVTVFASGILGGSPGFGLYAADGNGDVYELPNVEIARYQIIHNAPDPAVDIYLNDALAYENVAFRQATAFDFAPANQAINVKVVPTGADISEAVYDEDLTFADNGDTYVLVASGVVGDAATPFTIAAYGEAQEAAAGTGVDLLLYHGSPDAPAVDVIVSGTTDVLFDDVAYGGFSNGYLNVPADVYNLGITPADDNTNELLTYVADVSGLEGGAATVFASGFFAGEEPAFDVWVALADGTTFPLEMVISTDNLNGLLNQFILFPNPVSDNAFVQIDMKESVNMRLEIVDMSGRILKVEDLGTVATGKQSIELNVSQLASGSYMLRLISEKGVAALKFVK